MMLTDAGPLIALINRNDPNHQKCVAALADMPSGPLVTTWPCFTEAMHLLFRAGGYPAQKELWRWVLNDRVRLHELSADAVAQTAALMDKYRDRPMDLADASLVAMASALSLQEVFTLDDDFHVYRLSGGASLRVMP
jgi:predicted nucleic acid-binding protein